MLTIKFNPSNMGHIPGVEPLSMTWNDPYLTVTGMQQGIEQAEPIVGQVFNLAELPDGSTLIQHPFFEKAERDGSDYSITVILPLGPTPPKSSRFPEVLEVTENGLIVVPTYNEEPAEQLISY